MKIGIIGAMDQEIKILKEQMENPVSWERVGALFISGGIGRHEIILVRWALAKWRRVPSQAF